MTDLLYRSQAVLRRIRWDVDRFFDDFVGWPRPEPIVDWLIPEPFRSVSLDRVLHDRLAVDMVETDDAITIRTALPGVRSDDVEIEERDGWLSIRARSRMERDRARAGWHMRERRYGAWQRTLRLPASVNVDKADAQLHNGVLTVTLPKGEASKPLLQRIKVNLPKLTLPKLGPKKDRVKVHR